MSKNDRLLDKIDKARGDRMVRSIGGDFKDLVETEWDDPGLAQVKRLSDDELAEVIAREPQSKLGQLALTVQRGREAWRTPAKWALIVSTISLVVAIAALARTF